MPHSSQQALPHAGPQGRIYDLMMAREAGDWERVTNLGKQLNLSLYCMDKTYNEAMRWAHQVANEIRPDRP